MPPGKESPASLPRRVLRGEAHMLRRVFITGAIILVGLVAAGALLVLYSIFFDTPRMIPACPQWQPDGDIAAEGLAHGVDHGLGLVEAHLLERRQIGPQSATSPRFRHQRAGVSACSLVRVQVRARPFTAVCGRIWRSDSAAPPEWSRFGPQPAPSGPNAATRPGV